MSKRKWFALALVLLLAIVLVMSLIPAGCAPEAPKHVKFTSSNWIGDWLVVYVPKILVEDELGYTSEIVNVSVPAMWAALGANEINVTTIPWLPNQENFKKEYADRVEYLGVMYPDAPQGVFVPKWMYDQGIRAVSDLNDPELAKQFDIDGDGKGDWLGCDPGWACAQQNDEFIEMYGLQDLYTQMVGDAHLLTAAFEGRMRENKPVMMYQFYPHQMFIDYPIGEAVMMLDDPMGYDKWFTAQIEKFASKQWIAENPEATKLLRAIQVTTDDVMWSMEYIREKGDDPATLDAHAREWMAANKATVDSWLEAIK